MGRRALNLESKIFENFKVLHQAPRKKLGLVEWVCECVCGNSFIATSKQIKRRRNLSCGCRERCKLKDTPIGSIFGKLRMVGRPVDKGNGHIYAEFECECGTVKEIYVSNAVKGKTTSCGCSHAESVTTHGHCKKGKRTLTYLSYHSMLARCLDPNHAAYDTYKNIKICDRWNPYEGGSYENFLEDLGERPGKLWTLDRVDTLLGYSAENCKWSTKSEQAFNQKRSSINTSGRTGVFWNKSRQRWVVQLMKEGKYYWIGQYKDYEEACLAVSAAELELFGFQRDTYQ